MFEGLETERLTLRPPRMEDVPEYLEHIYGDPEVMRYLGTVDEPVEEFAPKRMAARIESHEKYGFALWTMRLRATGEFVGACGLQPIERVGPEIEIGYHTARRYWRQGITTEAALATLAWAFQVKKLDRVIAVCLPENVGSYVVMERIGMRRVGLTDRYYQEPTPMELLLYEAEAGWWKLPSS